MRRFPQVHWRIANGDAELSRLVATLERRQGMKIACPEEIAWNMGFIDEAGLIRAADLLGKSSYGQYLRRLPGL